MTIKPAPVICDNCGAEKKETNHWFSMAIGQMSRQLFVDQGINASFDAHVCGHNCASILLARWMQTGKLEETHAKAEAK